MQMVEISEDRAMPEVKIEVLRVAQDARGYVFEPLATDACKEFRNVHVVYTIPGVVRGNHYHPLGTEICSVAGSTLVRYRLAGVIHDVQVPAGQVWRFTFPAGVPHALRNDGTEPTLLASFSTEPHDPNQPDTIRELLLS
jgi:dTDP-4-dehydrorhamnose 3,5-epimerase-like enzyme